jgi:hypothetical protein
MSHEYHYWTLETLSSETSKKRSRAAATLSNLLTGCSKDIEFEYVPYGGTNGETTPYIVFWRKGNEQSFALTSREFLKSNQ